jgi:hypothetical protein
VKRVSSGGGSDGCRVVGFARVVVTKFPDGDLQTRLSVRILESSKTGRGRCSGIAAIVDGVEHQYSMPLKCVSCGNDRSSINAVDTVDGRRGLCEGHK